MKIILIILSFVLVVGCTSKMDEAKAKVFCNDKGGVYLTRGDIDYIRVICNNGLSKNFSYKEWDGFVSDDIAEELKKIK